MNFKSFLKLYMRRPRNKQLKTANVAYKNDLKHLDEILDDLEDDGINVDLVNRSFFKHGKTYISHIVDEYDDIFADKLLRKSWKDKRKNKKQYEV